MTDTNDYNWDDFYDTLDDIYFQPYDHDDIWATRIFDKSSLYGKETYKKYVVNKKLALFYRSNKGRVFY